MKPLNVNKPNIISLEADKNCLDFFILFRRKPPFPIPLIPLLLANIFFPLSTADKRNIRDLKQSLHKHQTSDFFWREVFPYRLNLPPQPSCKTHLSLTDQVETHGWWNEAPSVFQKCLIILCKDLILLYVTLLTSNVKKNFLRRRSFETKPNSHQATTGSSCLLSLLLKTRIFSVDCWAHTLFFFK